MSKLLISQYHAEVDRIIQFGGSRKETAVRNAFFKLLNQYCEPKHFLLIPELDYQTKFGTVVYPDGTVKDALRLDWGYWESKGQEQNLDAKIREKLSQGYPNDNILFENAQMAVLIQRGEEVLRVSMQDADKLEHLLNQFINYERPEVKDFRQAIDKFKADLPTILQTLREMIDAQEHANARFRQARDKLLDTCRKTINPDIMPLDIREMMIQHILTDEIFLTVFNEAQFHHENNVARQLQAVVDTFFIGSLKHNTLAGLESYYAAIRREATRIHNHHEKQRFLKVVYENFYKIYNPKAADRLGVVYTPNEIVRFMIESADYLVYKHFGKLLADPNVEILDPAAGTGTFIAELIEYLPNDKLEYKYKQEIYCNEVAILSYYIANLNIEYTYKQKMGKYAEFQNICFVDTLDNLGFGYSGKQESLFGFGEENTERIKRQNERKISVIIGNPPYNANQKNENENNKNRPYDGIDERIKTTYAQYSTAQKTKVYDMYARFFRWASDRLNKNGVVTFITNSSFLEAKGFDGFRKVVQDEFSEIWIIDLGGNLRKGETGNVFGIKIGVAISFLVKDSSQTGKCKIFYAKPDINTAKNKLEFLSTTRFEKINFLHITPDNKYNWLNLTDNDFTTLLPLIGKKSVQALFNLVSNGVATNRDEWVYDFSQADLESKCQFFMNEYNSEVERWIEYKRVNNLKEIKAESSPEVDKFLHARNIIKWSKMIKRDKLRKEKKGSFDRSKIRKSIYRPFVSKYLYFDYIPIDIPGQHDEIFPDSTASNQVIWFKVGEDWDFFVLAIDKVPDLLPQGGSCCLPLYRYDEHGNRLDNITDWGLQQFREHYQSQPCHCEERSDEAISAGLLRYTRNDNRHDITKLDIFHYTYAVLHNPAYRQKYELNLKREFPRLPFCDDFWQWVEWGKHLMDLHLNYETVESYPLERRDQHVVQQNMPGTPESARPVITPKPKLKADKLKNAIILDSETSLHGVPPIAWEYKLGNRSALEWILDQYKEKTPKDPTIAAKFNTYRFADYKEQVIDLLKRVCTVSVRTMEIIQAMERLQES